MGARITLHFLPEVKSHFYLADDRFKGEIRANTLLTQTGQPPLKSGHLLGHQPAPGYDSASLQTALVPT
jgi:hypothetical protein